MKGILAAAVMAALTLGFLVPPTASAIERRGEGKAIYANDWGWGRGWRRWDRDRYWDDDDGRDWAAFGISLGLSALDMATRPKEVYVAPPPVNYYVYPSAPTYVIPPPPPVYVYPQSAPGYYQYYQVP